MAHILLAPARRHPLDRVDEVREIPRNRVGRQIVGKGGLSPSAGWIFNPALYHHPREKRFRSFQPLEVGDRQPRSGFAESTGVIDSELSDVRHAVFIAESHE